MLIGNYSIYHKSPGRFFCGTTIAETPANFNKPSTVQNRFYACEGLGYKTFVSIPNGYTPPYSWQIAQTSGGMATYTIIYGTGSVTNANLAGGLNGVAALTGSGTISNADMKLVLYAAAVITGQATLTADIKGVLLASAALTGSGTVTDASLTAIAHMVSDLTGEGTVDATLSGTGSMSADINVTGDLLTTANVADAIWNAIAARYNESGTMGEKLNSAGTAGNPWTEVIEGTLTAEQAMRLLVAVAAGKTTIVSHGGGSATVTFKDTTDTKDRIVADMTGSERTTITKDLS